MVTKEVIQAVSELILPDINRIREDNLEIKVTLAQMDKRLGAIDTHLIDQSRRIDEVRTELGQRIEKVRTELGQRIDEVRMELGQRIDAVHTELGQRIDATNQRIDTTNQRLDRLAEVIVRREEFSETVMKVLNLEREINEIKRTIAA